MTRIWTFHNGSIDSNILLYGPNHSNVSNGPRMSTVIINLCQDQLYYPKP